MIFEETNDFVDYDNRKTRPNHSITKEILIQRHQEFLPKEIIEGKSVLDLGCCIGATGAWCLDNGASKYVGVDIQEEYTATATELLSKHFSGKPWDIVTERLDSFLHNTKEKFDVIIAWGVIYAYVDPFAILKLMSFRLKYNGIISIEGWQPELIVKKFIPRDVMIVEMSPLQTITLGGQEADALAFGSRISHTALIAYMNLTNHELIYARESVFENKYVCLFTRTAVMKTQDTIEQVTDAIQNKTFKLSKWKKY